MDKERLIRNNSIRNTDDSYIIRGNYLMTYSESKDRITLEAFKFKPLSRAVIINTPTASTYFPGVWDIKDSFKQMDYLFAMLRDVEPEYINIEEEKA